MLSAQLDDHIVIAITIDIMVTYIKWTQTYAE